VTFFLFGKSFEVFSSSPNFRSSLSPCVSPSTSTIPDYSTTTDISGNWSQIITLEEGINQVIVKAVDAAHNEIETVLLLTLVVNSLVISEVQISDTGVEDDFIELYNPTDEDIYLDDYYGSYIRLVKRTKTGTSDTSIKSWYRDSEVKVPAGGYYLWANSDYTDIGVMPDATTTATISDDNGIALRLGPKDTGLIIDSLGWGDCENEFIEGEPAVSLSSTKSLERKAKASSTAEQLAVLGDEYYLGNGYDSDNNSQDFVLQPHPNPQNSLSSWSSPRLVAEHVYENASNPSIVLDESENPLVVYQLSGIGSGPKRFLFTRFDGLSWSSPETLSCFSPGQCSCIKANEEGCLWAKEDSFIVRDQSGDFHVFFSAKESPNEADIYWTYLKDGDWSELENISLSSTTDSFNPSAIIDEQGRIHLTWQESHEIYYSNLSFSGNEWLKSDIVSISQSQELNSSNPFLITDQSNKLNLFWFNWISYPIYKPYIPTTTTGIYYSQQINGLNWASSTQIFETQGFRITPIDRFSLDIDKQGEFHLAWSSKNDSGQTHIFYSRTVNGVWIEPIELFTDLDFIYKPYLILIQGKPYIFGAGSETGDTGNLKIYLTYFNSQTGIWQEPINLNKGREGSFHPVQAILAEEKGVVYLFWHDNSSGRAKVYVSQKKIDNF